MRKNKILLFVSTKKCAQVYKMFIPLYSVLHMVLGRSRRQTCLLFKFVYVVDFTLAISWRADLSGWSRLKPTGKFERFTQYVKCMWNANIHTFHMIWSSKYTTCESELTYISCISHIHDMNISMLLQEVRQYTSLLCKCNLHDVCIAMNF